MAKLQDRAKDRASDVRPYLERALKDERVREDVKSAIATAREIYEQLLGGRQYTAWDRIEQSPTSVTVLPHKRYSFQ